MPDDSPPRSGPPAFVLVRAAVAPLHAEARVSSPQTSQALAGHPLLVLEERPGGWLRVAGEDGYPGWMHRGYAAEASPDHIHDALGTAPGTAPPWEFLAAGTPAAPRVALAADRLTVRVSLGCTADGAGGPWPLPLGAWVRGDTRVVSGDAVAAADRARRFPRTAAAIAHGAATLFAGTSYQWGGVSPWGADCSGFVQTVFALHGCALPRDAWQQALLGDDAGSAPARLRPADLLFFSDRDDGRITHVGVALGETRMAHVALGRGGFAIERLDDTGDPYVARLVQQLRGTRRVV